MPKLRVAVLMGGASSERAVSFATGSQISAALDPARYHVWNWDPAPLFPCAQALQPDAPEGVLPLPLAEIADPQGPNRPDVAFIALHGKGGEDGSIQGLLQTLGIPYTGSGILAGALAMNKSLSKRLFRSEGIRVADDVLILRHQFGHSSAAEVVGSRLGYPVVVKPNTGGSTLGCTIVRKPEQLEGALHEAFRHDDAALVERYLTGTEITASVLGNVDAQVLPLIEIVAHGGFYDYHAKYAPGGSTHIIPARISAQAADTARDYALRCHQVLGCRGMSRVDMIVQGDQPYVLEVNTIPGMTPTSLLPEAAKAAGISFPQLLDRIIGYALEDLPAASKL
ncbi:MAG: D-alanine--D-alanine ligase family protein [Chthonomonadales bacterium]